MQFFTDFFHQKVPRAGREIPGYFQLALLCCNGLLIVYFLVGLVLPVNPYDDDNYERGYRDGQKDGRRDYKRSGKNGKTYYYHPEPEDFVDEQARAESAEEAERRKKESDWDNRFTNS